MGAEGKFSAVEKKGRVKFLLQKEGASELCSVEWKGHVSSVMWYRKGQLSSVLWNGRDR